MESLHAPLWFVLHIKLQQFPGNTKVTSLQPRQEQGLSLRVSGWTASLLAHSIISGGKKIVLGLDRRAPHTTHTHPAAFLRTVVQQGDERELELKALCFAYHSYFGKPFVPLVRFPPPPPADIDSNQMQMQGAE